MSDNTLEHADADNPDIRVLREKAAKADAAEKALAEANRKLLFSQAGIDTTDAAPKLAKMLFDSSTADTLEALKAEATEIGLLKAPEPPPEVPHPDAGMQAFRQGAGAGIAPEADKGPNPWDVGYKEFHEARARGIGRTEAQLALVDRIVSAGASGDARVLVKAQQAAHAQAAALADEMAML